MAKKFSELRAKMSPEAQAKAEALAKRYLAELPLDELRVARNMSQENLAQVLGVRQNAVSKLERRTDMYVSSLRNVIRAMGGDLRIEAVFPDGVVLIDQFKKVAETVRTGQVDVSSKVPAANARRGQRRGGSFRLHANVKQTRTLARSSAKKTNRMQSGASSGS